MIESTVLQEFSTWASQSFMVSAIAGGVMWDTIKGQLLVPFKNKFSKYFDSEDEAERYFEKINNDESINKKKPQRDIEDIYEEITDKEIPGSFIHDLNEFLKINKEKIELINREQGDFTVTNQHASRDINNVKGSQTIINYGRN